MDIIYSTDNKSAEDACDKVKEAIVKRTCNSCKQNPLMEGCTCNPEMTDINNPTCLIVHQTLQNA